MDANAVIKLLNLEPLPEEGGYYSEQYRAVGKIAAAELPQHAGERCYSTAIYYLLTPEEFSALHRVKSDELFHFYMGDAVEMVQIHPHGQLETIVLGHDLANGQRPLATVPHDVWQGTRLVPGGAWALLGCTVAPGFEFEDFEVQPRDVLTQKYPSHKEAILSYTRA